MPSPPARCLRGTINITAVAASALGTAQTVPLAVYLYDSAIGHKPELAYQKLDSSWVEISKPSTTPGIYEAPPIFDGEVQGECDTINSTGIIMWTAARLQQWASDNTYAFFKDIVGNAPIPGTGPVTPANFLDRVNASLADDFQFLDTNGDGVPEFHGK